jgi:hypothetical protein
MAIEIRTWVFQPRHRNWTSTSKLVIEDDGSREKLLPMGLVCRCGEALHGGDPIWSDDEFELILVHENCADLLTRVERAFVGMTS